MVRGAALSPLAVGLALAATAFAVPPPPSALIRVGCVAASSATPGCTAASGIERPTRGVVSPDGRNVYIPSSTIVGGKETAAIAEYSRSTTQGPGYGALTQLAGPNACLTFDADGDVSPDFPGCAMISNNAVAAQIFQLAVSPDGNFVYSITRGSKAVLWFARDTAQGPNFGALTYVNCISYAGLGSCGMSSADSGILTALAMSHDGRNIYVGSNGSGTLVSFKRNTSTGALSTVGCVVEKGLAATGCTATGRGIIGPVDIAVSPDDTNVYVTSPSTSDGVAGFTRDLSGIDPTGDLTQISGLGGCVTMTGANHFGGDAGVCSDGRGVNDPYGTAISGDGLSIYTGSSNNDAVAIITRDPATGGLSQAAATSSCLSDDPDGPGGNPPADPECDGAQTLNGAGRPFATADGKTVYVLTGSAGDNGVTVFDRAQSGALTRVAGADGCISGTAAVPNCTLDPSLADPTDVWADSSEHSVYISSFLSKATIAFQRGEAVPACADVSLTTPQGAAVTVPLSCTDANGDPETLAIATQPAHGTLGAIDTTVNTVQYTPAAGYSGPDSFTFTASDWAGPSAPATASIQIQGPPSAGPGPGDGPGPATALEITTFRLTRKRFAVGPGPTPVTARKGKVKRGTTFVYALSTPATLTIAIQRKTPGRRSGKRCVSPSPKLRRAKRCTRWVTAGRLTRRTRPAGTGRIAFSGRIGRKALRPGAYRAVARAKDAAGRVSKTKTAAFVIIKA